jgi:glyoxylase-like metal-dependent hydrolase (beta-lactamase superfamily II)
MPDVTIQALEDGVFLASRPLEEGIDVRAVLLIGATSACVIDTLARPEDMAPFIDIVDRSGLRCIVVDTHADWDHAWGNCAFANSSIIGHTLCEARLRSREARDELARKRNERSGFFDGVRLVPPTVTFESQMTIDLGTFEIRLHHLPGHTRDSIVAYVPQRGLLIAGDCVEEPFPLLESGPLDTWVAALRAWSLAGVRTVIPAHGSVGGPELLVANAAYLESLRGDPPPPADALAFYHDAHRRNVATARALEA